MNSRRLLIATLVALGIGAVEARELPEDIRSFAADQIAQARAQKDAVRERIRQQVWRDFESTRTAFIERQMRAIDNQGAVALADIRQDLQLIRLEGLIASVVPRPRSRVEAPLEADAMQIDR